MARPTAMIEYRGYEITFRKGDRIADVRKSGAALTAETITRDKSRDGAWLEAEAKAFVDADLSGLSNT